MKFSNPVKEFTTNDWPYGSLRTTATFTVESNKRGERVSRVTVNPKNGRINKPKATTYALKARIVTGDDNRTYVLELTQWGAVRVIQSDLQHTEGYIHPDDEQYADIIKLFD